MCNAGVNACDSGEEREKIMCEEEEEEEEEETNE
tara:strand:+ start:3989 stop:4090 length:102 start_codon:yes stop_codon:yes gene_type:complete